MFRRVPCDPVTLSFVLLLTLPLIAQFKSQPVDVPGAVETHVGYGMYGAGYLVDHLSRDLRRGSLTIQPKITRLGYPDAAGTYPFAVNNQRVVVGTFVALDGSLHGFVAAAQQVTYSLKR